MSPNHLKFTNINYVFRWRIICVLALLIFWPTGNLQARYASIVVDYDTGKVLHAANADTRNYPASLTKMMTLYLAFEALRDGKLRIDRPLPVSAHAEQVQPSKIGLKRGTTIKAGDAINSLITRSANDAAIVLAEALGGTEHNFALRMTKRAHEIGMKNTVFRNASGLPNPRQLSTARDMSILSQRLITDFPEQYALFSMPRFSYAGRSYRNHNALLEDYPGTDGIKTGYTRASGYNLAASVERDGRRIIGVVFGGNTSRERNNHMRDLLDKGFASLPAPSGSRIARAGLVPAETGEGDSSPVERIQPAATSSTAGAHSSGVDRWAIQVGAFSGVGSARRAAQNAVKILHPSMESAELAIVPTRSGKETIYRARLVGLSRREATDACRRLKAQKLGCLAVAPPTP